MKSDHNDIATAAHSVTSWSLGTGLQEKVVVGDFALRPDVAERVRKIIERDRAEALNQ
jgi:hypothetical protein